MPSAWRRGVYSSSYTVFECGTQIISDTTCLVCKTFKCGTWKGFGVIDKSEWLKHGASADGALRLKGCFCNRRCIFLKGGRFYKGLAHVATPLSRRRVSRSGNMEKGLFYTELTWPGVLSGGMQGFWLFSWLRNDLLVVTVGQLNLAIGLCHKQIVCSAIVRGPKR